MESRDSTDRHLEMGPMAELVNAPLLRHESFQGGDIELVRFTLMHTAVVDLCSSDLSAGVSSESLHPRALSTIEEETVSYAGSQAPEPQPQPHTQPKTPCSSVPAHGYQGTIATDVPHSVEDGLCRESLLFMSPDQASEFWRCPASAT